MTARQQADNIHGDPSKMFFSGCKWYKESMLYLVPLVIDRLKHSIRIGVIEIAVPLTTFPGIPSGSETLLVSKALKISCTVQRTSSGSCGRCYLVA